MAIYQLGRQPARMGFMNIGVARAVKPLTIYAGLLMLFARASAAHASVPDPVADVIRTARTATSADVYIVPNTIATIKQIDQNEVPLHACRYPVTKEGMSELFEVIERAEIKMSDREDRKPDVRFLIQLYRDGAAPITFAFKRFTSLDDRVHGFANGIDASAASDFPENIRRWAAGITPKPNQKYLSCP